MYYDASLSSKRVPPRATGPRWVRRDSEMGSRWDRDGSEMDPMRFRDGSEMGPRWVRRDSDAIPMRFRCDSDAIPMRFRSDYHLPPTRGARRNALSCQSAGYHLSSSHNIPSALVYNLPADTP